ncbi:MAG: PilT/PilU family type 4a pilus ATPase, partial [Kiritimatiellae bacterium]|nr:PilT/PilU family type 4a pilus ATPase [Kiritimatiellia bacterium]
AAGRPGAWPAERGSLDGACSSASGARYRFNVFRRQNPPGSAPDAPAVALRRLDDRFRSLAELGLPSSLRDFCAIPHGLVIVTGPTGSGKSTTLATLVDEINRTRGGHIVTIEDPVEYVHRPVKALVNQRQVGTDAPDFLSALVDALREDPDVILVGEIRDPETIRTAVVAAETGHLVFATLHAGDCPGAVERFVAVFPSGEQDAVRRQLALVLRGVVAQRLVPAEDGSGTRVAVCEVMRVTPAVANLIANGRSAQLYTAIETGSAHGMQTMEQDLSRLVRLGKLSLRTARALARRPETLAPGGQA